MSTNHPSSTRPVPSVIRRVLCFGEAGALSLPPSLGLYFFGGNSVAKCWRKVSPNIHGSQVAPLNALALAIMMYLQGLLLCKMTLGKL